MENIQQLREAIKVLFDQLTYNEQEEIIDLIKSMRSQPQGEV